MAHYVRETHTISTGAAIYKMSKWPAQRIGLQSRGRIEVGAMADIAVMDLETVQDHASFENPHQYASGVKHVLVNGEWVLKDGQMTGKRPGRALRSGQ
jgi:N-acyl-D-aspartate/D-glutamate deacylase